jgi:DNA-binding MarR family transcriptional regulator
LSSAFTSPPADSPLPLGPPLIGALLRMPLEVVRARMLDALHERGFADLVPAHLVILRYPGPDGRRPGELAARTSMSKQAVNYLLGQLEGLGYIERRDDPDDRRSKLVYLTPRGLDAALVIRAAVTEGEQEWADELGADTLDELRALLIRLNGVIDVTRARPGTRDR